MKLVNGVLLAIATLTVLTLAHKDGHPIPNRHHNHLKRSKRGENGSRKGKRNRESKSQSKSTCAVCSSAEDQIDFFTTFDGDYNDQLVYPECNLYWENDVMRLYNIWDVSELEKTEKCKLVEKDKQPTKKCDLGCFTKKDKDQNIIEMGCIDGNNVWEEYGWRKSQFKKLTDNLIPCGGVDGTLCYICKRSKSTRKDVCNDQYRETNFTEWKLGMDLRTSTTAVNSIQTPLPTTIAPTKDLVPASAASTATSTISTLETATTSSMASSPVESEGSPEEGADPVGGTAGKLKSGNSDKTKSDKSSAITSNISCAIIFAYFFALTLF